MAKKTSKNNPSTALPENPQSCTVSHMPNGICDVCAPSSKIYAPVVGFQAPCIWVIFGRFLGFMVAVLFFCSGISYAQDTGKEVLSGLNLEDFEKPADEGSQWKNNPFVQVVDEVSVSDMQLTAIVYSEEKSAALINGQVLHDGDKLGLTEVVHIASDRVVLRNESGIFNLVLKGKSE